MLGLIMLWCVNVSHRVIDEVVAEKSKRMFGAHKEANLKGERDL